MHTTIPKGIVGGFEFTVLQRNLKDLMAWEAMDVCLWMLKESNKSRFDGYDVRNSSVYPILPFAIVALTFFSTSFLKIVNRYILNRYIFDWNKLGWLLCIKFHVSYYFSDMNRSSQLNVSWFQSLDEKKWICINLLLANISQIFENEE